MPFAKTKLSVNFILFVAFILLRHVEYACSQTATSALATHSFITTSYTDCVFNELTATLSELVDLATPTPLIYVDTRTVHNCSVTTMSYDPASPLETEFMTQWFVATVNGIPYPAENSIAITQAVTTTTYITNPITFPGLTVTQLTPGEAITLGWIASVGPSFYGSGSFYLFVPTDATPYSSSTPTASPTPTAATSRDTGAIAGGAVAAVILLGMICGMLLYFRRKKKRLSQGVRSLTFKSQYSDRADDEDELQELPSANGLRVEGHREEAVTKIFDS